MPAIRKTPAARPRAALRCPPEIAPGPALSVQGWLGCFAKIARGRVRNSPKPPGWRAPRTHTCGCHCPARRFTPPADNRKSGRSRSGRELSRGQVAEGTRLQSNLLWLTHVPTVRKPLHNGQQPKKFNTCSPDWADFGSATSPPPEGWRGGRALRLTRRPEAGRLRLGAASCRSLVLLHRVSA